jgi:hypothetical protein
METLACFDAKTVGAGLLTGTVPSVHTVSWAAANGKLLIGVDSGDLYEMSGVYAVVTKQDTSVYSLASSMSASLL